jgi:hypothetical protein
MFVQDASHIAFVEASVANLIETEIDEQLHWWNSTVAVGGKHQDGQGYGCSCRPPLYGTAANQQRDQR